MSNLQDTFHRKFIKPVMELLFKKVTYESRMEHIMECVLKDRDIDHVKKLYASMLCDIVDDEEAIRKIAEPHLTDFELNGDSYGVPSIVDIVETLTRRLDKYKLLEGRANDEIIHAIQTDRSR